MEEPHKRPDFSKLVVTISLTLEALAGYMSLNTTSLIIVDADKGEHQVATVAKKADISAASLDLASPDKDEHPFVAEEIEACDPGMEVKKLNRIQLTKYLHIMLFLSFSFYFFAINAMVSIHRASCRCRLIISFTSPIHCI